MNEKAKEMDLKNTHFVTPHGLDQDEHYTTAFELAVLADYGLKIDKFKKIVGTKSYNVNINGYTKSINNTNELLGNLNGVYGVKTGFTNGANRCLVTAIKRDSLDVICVVLGADTKKFRTQDSVKLIEYTFKNYKIVNLENKIIEEFSKWKEDINDKIEVIKGMEKEIKVNLDKIKFTNFPIIASKENQIQVLIENVDTLEAPVAKNQKIGSCKIILEGNVIDDIDIIMQEDIQKKNVIYYFKQLLKDYFIYLKQGIEI